jgi:hypothetical protein
MAHLWVNPPSTPIPLAGRTVRFAVGTPDAASTNSWRVWTHRNDAYIACRDNFREFKVSLHASGKWRLGVTATAIEECPDLLAEGVDRAWHKWAPDLSDPTRAFIAFQLLVPEEGLYLTNEQRGDWPPSVVFIETLKAADQVTIVSVVVAPSKAHLQAEGALLAVLPLGAHRTVQIFGSYQSDEYIRPMLLTGYAEARRKIGQVLPETGTIILQGIRPEGIPWLSALPARFERSSFRACKEFCVCEPYDGSRGGRDVWHARSTTTGLTGTFWTG